MRWRATVVWSFTTGAGSGVSLHDLARVAPRRPRSRPATRARSSSACGSAPTRAARSPASASTRARPTPARTSATCGPTAARCWRPPPSPARPPRAGSRSPSPRRSPITANTTYVASYHTNTGNYGVNGGVLRLGRRATTRRCTRWPTGVDGANGVYATAASGVPDADLQRHQLLGRRRVQHRRAGHDAADGDERRAGQRRHRRRPGDAA